MIIFIFDSDIGIPTIWIPALITSHPAIHCSSNDENRLIYAHVCVHKYMNRDKLKELIFFLWSQGEQSKQALSRRIKSEGERTIMGRLVTGNDNFCAIVIFGGTRRVTGKIEINWVSLSKNGLALTRKR